MILIGNESIVIYQVWRLLLAQMRFFLFREPFDPTSGTTLGSSRAGPLPSVAMSSSVIPQYYVPRKWWGPFGCSRPRKILQMQAVLGKDDTAWTEEGRID